MDNRDTLAKTKRPKSKAGAGDSAPQAWMPWQIDSPFAQEACDCPPTYASDDPEPSKPERIVAKKDACCEQIFEALKCIPGIDPECIKRRKPKTPPHVKLLNLARDLPGKESVAPLLMLILRRYRADVPPANDFEARMHDFLSSFSKKQMEPLTIALDAYDALPQALREEVFETRFDSWPNGHELEPDFLKTVISNRILELGQHIRKGEGLKPGPGKTRVWEQSFLKRGEPGVFEKLTGPWPYICAISPTGQTDVSTKNWFRNESSRYPGNLGPNRYHPHEFARECHMAIVPPSVGGGARLVCNNVEPGGGGQGGFGFAQCFGGIDYNVTDPASGKQLCLKVPQVLPGATVGLRGFNFFSTNIEVRIRQHRTDGSVGGAIKCAVSEQFGDMSVPSGEASCKVRDELFFTFPGTIRDGNNDIELPPGYYTLEVNVTGNPLTSAAGIGVGGGGYGHKYVSNRVLVELLPPNDKRFTITCDSAFCLEETDGGGADEPWFQSVNAILALPTESDGNFDMQWSGPVDILQAEDVDSGEWITFPHKTIFDGQLAGQILAIGLIGLEIDSEDAAKERVKGFWDSYALYLRQALVLLGLSGSSGVLIDAFKVFAVSRAFPWYGWVAGAVAVLIFGGGFLFATWAEADPLAFDVLVYTAGDFHAMTNADNLAVGEDYYYWLPGVQIFVTPLGKQLVTGGEAASYREARMYRSSDEHSRYELKFTTKRA